MAYCTLCGAGVLFDTRVGDAAYEFGSSGFLMRSNKLMYDRTTYTLWNQLTGEPVLGKLADGSIELKRLPVVVTRWRSWLDRHPDTQVLSLETGHLRDYTPGKPPTAATSPVLDTMFPAGDPAQRLPDKARIFALYIDGQPHALATADVARERVVNDRGGRYGGRSHCRRSPNSRALGSTESADRPFGTPERKSGPTSARTTPSNPPKASSKSSMPRVDPWQITEGRAGRGRTGRRSTGWAGTWPTGSAGVSFFPRTTLYGE